MAGKKADQELQGIALFASLLGNLSQSSKNKELTAEQARLVELVKGFREQAERVSVQLHSLRKAYEAQSEAYRALSDQNELLSRRYEELNQKYIATLEELSGRRGKHAGA